MIFYGGAGVRNKCTDEGVKNGPNDRGVAQKSIILYKKGIYLA